jgi:hypothetical protein
MDSYDIKRLALILAINAEIEGLKAENAARVSNNLTIAYDEDSFNEKATQLRNLAYSHNYEL